MAGNHKKSFFSSMLDGMSGYGIGLVLGGLLGAAVGLVVGLFALSAMPVILAAFISGFASLGAAAGLVTGVVKGREAIMPTENVVAHAMNAAFEKGVWVGQQRSQAQPESSVFRDRLAQEREQQQAAVKTLH